MNIGPDDIKTVAEVVVLATIGGYGAWKARKAEKQTVSTGNGFAKHVMDDLAEIKDELKNTNKKLDHHIQAHADADIAGRPRVSLEDVNDL
jgi:hypothetical protein